MIKIINIDSPNFLKVQLDVNYKNRSAKYRDGESLKPCINDFMHPPLIDGKLGLAHVSHSGRMSYHEISKNVEIEFSADDAFLK